MKILAMALGVMIFLASYTPPPPPNSEPQTPHEYVGTPKPPYTPPPPPPNSMPKKN